MKLTPEIKARIDAKDMTELLRSWRTSPVGDPMFTGESADYWLKRMNGLRAENEAAWVVASKEIGWQLS